MYKTMEEKKWMRWVACIVMMFAVFATTVFARDPEIDAGIAALDEVRAFLGKQQDDAIKNEDWAKARRALQKWRMVVNLLGILRETERKIVFGGVRSKTALAEVHYDDGSIHLHKVLQGADPRVIAQHLAHEASHLAHLDKKGTLDGEVLAWQEEMEVWVQFIRIALRNNKAIGNKWCDDVLNAVLNGEAKLRGHIRRLYPKFDKKDEDKIEKIPSHLYRAVFPSKYNVFFDEGKYDRYIGQHAIGPRNRADSYSAGISVTVAPQAVEGGQFDEPADQVKFLVANMQANASNFDLAKNDAIELDGVPALRLLFSYDIPVGTELTTRLKEEIIVAKRETSLLTIVFSADESEWKSCQSEFDAFLKSFRWEP
ncbi:MAG: hypothetical protein JW715_15010 [Sedimentisphaerales bacterium]|nr:hypothetical protein [Sedimentisphaerales bacterium]